MLESIIHGVVNVCRYVCRGDYVNTESRHKIRTTGNALVEVKTSLVCCTKCDEQTSI